MTESASRQQNVFPPEVTGLVYLQADLLQAAERRVLGIGLLITSVVTIVVAYLAAACLPGAIIKWILAGLVLAAGAVVSGLLFAHCRRPKLAIPLVVDGQVQRKSVSAKKRALEFHIDVRDAHHLGRDGQTTRIDALGGIPRRSIVCSPELFEGAKVSEPCHLFCLPSGECLAAYQDNQLIW